MPIYSGEIVEAHCAAEHGVVGETFGVTTTLENDKTFSGLNLDLMGTSKKLTRISFISMNWSKHANETE